MTQWVQKLWLSCFVVVLLTKTSSSSSQFVATIEIDADFTDADNDLQSQRMTDLDEELKTLFGHLEGFLELELESVWPANCNLVARVIVTVTSNVSVDDMDNLLETLQCAPVTIGGETYSVYDAVLSTGDTGPCAASGRYCATQATCEQEGCVCPPGMKGDPYLYCVPEDLEVCVIGGEQQLVTYEGWRGHVPTPCPYIAGMLTSDSSNECDTLVYAANTEEPVEGRFFLNAVAVLLSIPGVPIYYTDVEAINDAGQDPLAEVWRLNLGTAGPKVLTTYDPVSRTAFLTLLACNITVAFTSTNVSLDQPLARYTGLSVVAPPDLINERFKFPSAMCSAPPDVLTNDYPPDLLGIYGVAQQSVPDANVFPHQCCQVACEEAYTALSLCGDPFESIATCGPILAKPSLASCLPAPILDTFAACIRYVCQNDVDACNQLRTLADGSCPELATNLTLNC